MSLLNMVMAFCKQCNKELNHGTKYCSIKCQTEFQYSEYIFKWKTGLVNGKRGKYQLSNHIRRYLFEKYERKCSECGWDKTNLFTGKSPLEIDHVDGNPYNNSEENLKLICPNCHSLTATFKALNKGNGRKDRNTPL